MKAFILTILAAVLCFFIVKFFEDEKELCGRYTLTWSNGREAFISRPSGGDTMVHGNIHAYAVRAPYIAGYVTAETVDPKLNLNAKDGFFILDTTTDKRLEGLSRECAVAHPWPAPALPS